MRPLTQRRTQGWRVQARGLETIHVIQWLRASSVTSLTRTVSVFRHVRFHACHCILRFAL